jgi:type I restriction enzyme S subunit
MKKTIGKISDVCKVFAGQSPKGTSYNENCLGMEFHQGKKAFGDFFLGKSNVWTTEITTTAEPGDILMSVRAPVGPTNITKREICIGRGLAAIRCGEKVIPSFVLYALKNIENKIEGNNGAVFNSINKKMIEMLPIPIIGKDEQQRIVSYLDSAFAKIDAVAKNAENSLNEAKALFQSALTKMMEPKEGWEEKTLGELTTKITDGSHNPPKGVENSKYLMLSSKNIRDDKFTFDNPRYLTEIDFEKENTRTDVEKGDVLLTIVGAGLGQCCVYPADFKVTFQRSAAVIKPRKDVANNRFMMYALQNEYENIRAKSNGAAQKGIYLSQLANYVLAVPNLLTQQSIVVTLDSLKSKVDQLQSNISRTLSECAALKQSILRQTFE